MPSSVPPSQARAQAREIAALRAEVKRLTGEGERLGRGLIRMQKMAATEHAEVERLEHNTEAYRGALGYSVRGSHDGRLRDATLPINGIAEALTAEGEHLRIAHARADGALADAETVPTGDLERGIRALTAERDGLKSTLLAWTAECGEDGPRPIKADLRALAEALVTILDDVEHSWLTLEGRLEGIKMVARATLARPGVVRVRGEG